VDDYLKAILLGVVQALTEFLPISSSGHLVVAPEIIGDDVSSLTFDVGLHLGTMVAVIVYFWREWVEIISSGVRDVVRHRWSLSQWAWPSRLGLWIAIGTVPAVVFGLLFEDRIDRDLREPIAVGVALILGGLVLEVVDRWGATIGRVTDMTLGRSIAIGFAQAVALIPGVSRSGATIGMARVLGFERVSAARFSFLLSAPVVLGAGVLQLSEALAGAEDVSWGPMLVGAVTAAAVGGLVIRFLLAFLESRTLRPFVWYRIALGLAILLAAAFGAF
jgi:undecaprenyl-diphosphatase